MNEQKKTKPASARSIRTSGLQENNPGTDGVSRRTFLGVGSASLATAALASLAVNAQEREDTEKAEQEHSISNPGPENKPLLDENPNSNFPPPTDHGNIAPLVVLLRSNSQTRSRRRVDERGNRKGTALFQRSRGSQNAAYGGQLSGVALARGGRVGLYAVWKRSRDCS